MANPRDPEIDLAIATLARGLQGAAEVLPLFGIDSLPRPSLTSRDPAQAAAPVAPQAPAVAVASPARPRVAPAVPQAPDAPSAPRALPVIEPPDARADTAHAIARLLEEHAPAADKLLRLERDVVGACIRCKLHRGRNKLVFGVGNPQAELVFVGEGPGADEDRQGVPFVGKAGALLTRMIEAMGKKRDDVYICNVVKCRPPNNRDPEPDEVEACEGFLKAQLSILKPRVIVCLGRHAAQALLRNKTPITKLRGTWMRYQGVDVMPTYHPSYLLREEADPDKKRKREAWEDLKQVMKKLEPSA
jgi:uracil-DNA glycosylase